MMKKRTKEHRRNLSLALTGKKASEETRRRMSEAHRGHIVSGETKMKIRASNLGLKRSDEFCEKMSRIDSARRHTEEYKRRMSERKKGTNTGEKCTGWRGGRRKQGEGYWLIYSPEHPFRSKTKYVLEHRLVAEKCIGRYLDEGNQVHHINGKKGDNRPQNLMAFASLRAHSRFEAGKPVPAKDILFDGRLLKHSS